MARAPARAGTPRCASKFYVKIESLYPTKVQYLATKWEKRRGYIMESDFSPLDIAVWVKIK